MPIPPRQQPPPSHSPEFERAIALITERLKLSRCLAEVALGFFYGMSESEMSEWLGITKSAAHKRIDRRSSALEESLIRMVASLSPREAIACE